MRRGEELYCNKCGKKIQKKGTVQTEEFLHVEKEWGFFSGKDGEDHSFDLCENCYDQWTAQFLIPIEIKERTELL